MSKKILIMLLTIAFMAMSTFAFSATLSVPSTTYATIASAIAAAVAGDEVSVAGGSYAEDIVLGARITLKCSSADSIATITGAAGAGNVITIGVGATGTSAVAQLVLQNIAVDVSANTNKVAANRLVTAATGVNFTKLYNCTFKGTVAPAKWTTDFVEIAGASTDWQIENCTFTLNSGGAKGLSLNGAANVTNFDIIGNAFNGRTDYIQKAVFVSDNVVVFTGFYFGGNTFYRSTLQINYDDDAAGATYCREDLRIYDNVFTEADGIYFMTTNGSDAYQVYDTVVNAGKQLAQTAQILIKGNHFGSLATDGDKYFAIMFHGFLSTAVTEANIFINNNNFQYPMTNGIDTATGIDGGANAGHVTAVAASLDLAAISASQNYWGQISGPLTAYEDGGIAVVNTSGAYTYSSWINSYAVPQIDETNRGIEYYDYDNDGHLDRAVVWFDQFVDPSAISSYAGWAIADGYTFDTAKAPKLSLDNDNEASPDGTFALTLYLVEKSTFDTGLKPQLTYTSATGSITGITGNINAKLANVADATATEHDKARPVVKSAITKDNAAGGAPSKANNGFLDAILVTFSETVVVGGTRTAGNDTDWDLAIGALSGGYVKRAGLITSSADVVTIPVTEAGAADTGTKPTITFPVSDATPADDIADASGNYLSSTTAGSTYSGTTDGAAPVAISVATADFGSSNTGTGSPDGYIDGFTITFSENLKAIAAGDSGAVRSAFTIEKVENTVDLSTALLTASGNTVLTVKGRSLKDASAVGHPWDTDATPDLTYINAGGIKDTASNAWVYIWDGAIGTPAAVTKTTDVDDMAKPVIARATGQVNSKNLYVTFSEGVEGSGAAVGGGVLKQLLVAGDLQFHNIYNTGLNATAIASLSDANGTNNTVVAVMDEIFLVNDVVNDSLSTTGVVLRDVSGGAASGTGNTMLDVIVTINDVIAPTLLTATINDYDNDGWVDTIKLTFSEDINDAGITGYNGTDKISLNAATNWAVAGYTVVGLNFVSSGAEQTTATTDANTRGLTGVFDDYASFAGGVFTKKVINVGDVASDNILYLAVQEGSGTDVTNGDTDAVPALTVTGDTAAAVGDFKPNYLATATKTPTDNAGAALMAAEFTSANDLTVYLSEAVADTVTMSGAGVPTIDQLVSADFTFEVGTVGNTVSATAKDVIQTSAGVVELFFQDAVTTADNGGWIGLSGAGVLNDNAAFASTQTIATAVGRKTIVAWDGTDGSTPPPSGPLTAPSALAIADVTNDNGNWFIATFTPSTDTRVSSYQFYRRVITGTDTSWVFTALVPKLMANSSGIVKCYVPTPVNGSLKWAVVASSGSALSDMVAEKEGMAVAQLAPAGKLAEGILLSGISNVATGGAIDNIKPSNLTVYAAGDNAGAGTGILVSWTAPVDHNIVGWYGTTSYSFPIYGVTAYQIFRRTGNAVFAQIGTAPAGSTSYVDNVVDGTTVYTYRIKPTDGTFTLSTDNSFAMANVNANVADFSSDSIVDFTDFTMFASVYGSNSANPIGTWVNLYDLAPNGVVDFDDFTAFAANYGFGATKAAKEIAGVMLPVSNVAFTMDSKVDAATSMYYVNVNISDIAKLNGFDFKLAYDSSALELVKESINGLNGLTIQNDKDGVVDIANMFNGEQFNGTVTLGFKSNGTNSSYVFELTNALVSDKEAGISQVTKLSSITAKATPQVYSLSKNYPNPFNPTTTIEYAIPSSGKVELVVYNMAGQKVRTMVNETKEAGFFKTVWDGRNDRGETVASGLYFYKLVSGKFNKIEKMTLVK